MLAPPRTRAEFDLLVPDEATARSLFVRVRWPDGVCCKDCGSANVVHLTTRDIWQCRTCRAHTSVRSGTVLQASKLPYRDWLLAAWMCCRPEPASALAIARAIGRRYETALVLVHKIRASLAERGAWQLVEEFALGVGEVPADKLGKGDPPDRPPVELALAVDPSPGAPDALRAELATPRLTGAALLDEARHHHVHPLARPAANAERIVRAALRRVTGWLRDCFTGVSRRFMGNYVAHYGYLENRRHRGDVFVCVLGRMATEPWRSARVLALP